MPQPETSLEMSKTGIQVFNLQIQPNDNVLIEQQYYKAIIDVWNKDYKIKLIFRKNQDILVYYLTKLIFNLKKQKRFKNTLNKLISKPLYLPKSSVLNKICSLIVKCKILSNHVLSKKKIVISANLTHDQPNIRFALDDCEITGLIDTGSYY